MSFNPASQVSNKVEDAFAYVRIAKMVLARNNPLLNAFKQIQYMLYILMTIRQKLNIVKQRVNHMKYRLHQMEQLIQQNNQYVYQKGQGLNQIR